MTTIRPAAIEDAGDLARLRWEFRVEAGTPSSIEYPSFRSAFEAFASRTLADPDRWRAWVAEANGALVGCVWVQIVERVPHPHLRAGERPIVYVTTMYVAPEQRNAGIGRALLEEALAFARERRASGVILWPSERSRPFYERAGFGREGAPLGLELEGD